MKRSETKLAKALAFLLLLLHIPMFNLNRKTTPRNFALALLLLYVSSSPPSSSSSPPSFSLQIKKRSLRFNGQVVPNHWVGALQAVPNFSGNWFSATAKNKLHNEIDERLSECVWIVALIQFSTFLSQFLSLFLDSRLLSLRNFGI